MALVARLRALDGLLLGKRDRDRPRVGVGPSGAVGGPGWCEAGVWGSCSNRRPSGRPGALACLPHQAHRAFLVTFRASREGREELVGMRKVGGLRVGQRTPWQK